MRKYATSLRLGSVLACSVMLGACAMGPTKPKPQPAVVIPLPEAAPVTPQQIVAAKSAHNEPWAGMVTGFVMQDCADGPLLDAKATQFTRHPVAFERLLQQSMPLMMYVQKQLHAARIPDEFVMLPLLESGYDAGERSHGRDAAGMWQLMPRTARLRGIKVTRHYDGRRDPVASTEAAIAMLTNLYKRFGDWRVVDMAYNAGPYAVKKALRKHPELGTGAIPAIPVPAAAHKHLAKLMALACIIREPARFHITLPQAKAGDELVAVALPSGTRIADAADMAQIPETTLRALNPGYLGRSIPADSPRRLLLPAPAAQSLVAALTVATSESVAQVAPHAANNAAVGSLPLPLEPAPAPGDTTNASAATQSASHHRVRAGDSLWSIAHHYDVSVKDLKRWNHLDGNEIRAGEVLRVQG